MQQGSSLFYCQRLWLHFIEWEDVHLFSGMSNSGTAKQLASHPSVDVSSLPRSRVSKSVVLMLDHPVKLHNYLHAQTILCKPYHFATPPSRLRPCYCVNSTCRNYYTRAKRRRLASIPGSSLLLCIHCGRNHSGVV